MANNLKRASRDKWPGVYCYASDQRKIRGKQDICYYITFKVDGKKYTEKIGWKSEGYSPEVAAELRAVRVKTKRHGAQVKTSKEIRQDKQATNKTIEELKVAYFGSEKGLRLKGLKTDLNRYEKHLEKPFAKKRISELSEIDLARLKRDMAGHAPATIANTLELLRRIINHGKKNKLCPPLSFTIELPKKNNLVTEYLTPEEAERLMQVLENWPSQDAPRMLKIAWLTGMRRGEIFKLQDQDCDFHQKIISLRNPKGGSDESIPMSEPVAELLQEQIIHRNKSFPDSAFIFPGKKGGQRTDSSAVNRIKIEAKLSKDFRIFHGLRHHMAVTLASSGGFTLDMIGSLLTHKSSEMTRRYAKFLPDAKKKATDQAAEILQAHAANNGDEKIVQLKKVRNGN
jgi:integrase